MQDGVILVTEPYGVGLNETFLPKVLKEQGYATHAVGKVGPNKLFCQSRNLLLNIFDKFNILNLYMFSGIWDSTLKSLHQLIEASILSMAVISAKVTTGII